MAKHFITNERFLEGATELAHKIVVAQFGEGFVLEEEQSNGDTRYKEEVQDFFNDTFDEVVTILNTTFKIHSADELEDF